MTFTDWYRPVGITPECDSLLLDVPSHVSVSTGPSAWGSRRDRQGCHLRSAILIGFLASTKFATTFTSYMDSFAMWTAAWG